MALAAAVLSPCVAHAAARGPVFPGKAPVEITVPALAGSSADLTARVFAHGLAKRLGVAVTILNRPGAGGALGYRHVAAQKPDGRSLVWMSASIATAYHMGLLKLDLDAFEIVARVLVESPLVAVRSDSPWKTLRELVADAAARPEEITVAHAGRGSDTHFSSLALFRVAKVELWDVPLPRSHVVSLLLGGHVDAVVDLPASLAGPARSGSVRLLASLSPVRDPARPHVPTAQEQGYAVSLSSWRGIAAPRHTPLEIIVALEAAIADTVDDPTFGRAVGRLGVHPAFMPAADFAALIERQQGELLRLMQRMGLTGDLR
jgi:tripartite-type tricarboxylate transporter receptor subunit TctC